MRFMTIVKTRESNARLSQALIEAVGKLGAEAAKQGVTGTRSLRWKCGR
jgi:hypothetical protein